MVSSHIYIASLRSITDRWQEPSVFSPKWILEWTRFLPWQILKADHQGTKNIDNFRLTSLFVAVVSLVEDLGPVEQYVRERGKKVKNGYS